MPDILGREVKTGILTVDLMAHWLAGVSILTAICTLAIVADTREVSLGATTYSNSLQQGWLVGIAAAVLCGTTALAVSENRMYQHIIGTSERMTLTTFMQATTPGKDVYSIAQLAVRAKSWLAKGCMGLSLAHSVARIVLGGAVIVVQDTRYNANLAAFTDVPDITAAQQPETYVNTIQDTVSTSAVNLLGVDGFTAYTDGFTTIAFDEAAEYQLFVDTTNIEMRCEYSTDMELQYENNTRFRNITLNDGIGKGHTFSPIFGAPSYGDMGAGASTYGSGFNPHNDTSGLFTFISTLNCTDDVAHVSIGGGQCVYAGACIYNGSTVKRRVTVNRVNSSVIFNEVIGSGQPHNITNFITTFVGDLNRNVLPGGNFIGGLLASYAFAKGPVDALVPRDEVDLADRLTGIMNIGSTYGSLAVSRRKVPVATSIASFSELGNSARLAGSMALGCIGLASMATSLVILFITWGLTKDRVCLSWNGIMAGAVWQDSVLAAQLLGGKCALQTVDQLEQWEQKLEVCLAPDDAGSPLGHLSIQTADNYHYIDPRRMYALSRPIRTR